MIPAAILPAFDSEFGGPAEWAAMYRACGLQVVPSYDPNPDPGKQWKRPLVEWIQLQQELVPDFTFERWYGANGEFAHRVNMGLITGRCSGNLLVIDLDIYKSKGASEWWSGLMMLHNMDMEIETCEQRTGGGGRQLLFRAPDGFEIPTNKTTIGIDIRGQGGFIVCPPSRHTSGNAYSWVDGKAPWDTEIALAPAWLLDAVTQLVTDYGGSTGGSAPERTLDPSTEFDPFGARIDNRESYMTALIWADIVAWREECPIRPSGAESLQRMSAAFETYARGVKTRIAGAERVEGLEREDRGITAFRARWLHAMKKWDDEVAIEAAKNAAERPRPASSPPASHTFNDEKCVSVEQSHPEPVGKPVGKPVGSPQSAPADRAAVDAKNAPEPVTAPETGLIARKSAFPISVIEIPPRDWIIPGLLLRKHLSVIVAPPGSGKSLLTLHNAIMVADGRAWGGWTVRKPTRSLVINSEDDLDEMRRRLFAAAETMGINQEGLTDRVLLADDPASIVIARTDAKTKTVVRTPLLEAIIATIIKDRIGLVIVDPFAETFEGDENSNSEIKWAGILWREVARRTGCAVLLVHHTKKYASDMAGDADASRGGGALIGTARILCTLFVMTEAEATTMNVKPEDRTRYVRFDDAKANLTRITSQARWFEKVSVDLNNGSGMIPGDEVGALKPWAPPGLLEGVQLATIGLVLDTIDRGLLDEDGRPTGNFYTHADNSANKERWAGAVIARMLGCDDARAKKILSKWLEEPKVLDIFDYNDAKARGRKGLRSVLANRPGRVV